MALKGETLKAYNNLPAIPIEQPLGDLLNTIPVGDPALENPAGGVATLYIDASGSDDTGDGSQANPFATPQAALDAIPSTAARGTRYDIQCGAGTFPFPELSRLPPQVSVSLIGDRSNPVVSIPAGSVPFSKVAGKQSRWTGNVGAYADVVTDGSHWLAGTFSPGGSVLGYLAATSTSPNLEIIQAFDVTAFVNLELYAYATFFEATSLSSTTYVGPTDGSDANRTGGSVTLKGIVITNSAAGAGFRPRGVSFSGCAFKKNPAAGFFSIDAENCQLGAFFDTDTNLTASACGISTAYVKITTFWTIEGVGSSDFIGSVLYPVTINKGSSTLISGCDLEGTGTAISMFGGAPHVSLQNSTVDATLTSVVNLSSSINGSIQAAGTITGSCTGNGFVVTNGGQATGVQAACLGNLTTGGSDVVCGGNAGQSFVALPTTDLAAASPQLCRIT